MINEKTVEQINKLILKTHGIFLKSNNSISRQDYAKQNDKSGPDWHFSLTVDDIIKNNIGQRVTGCTGIARVFAKLATDDNFEVFILVTAEFESWNSAKKDNKTVINGHALIAIKTDDGLFAFDPSKTKFKIIPANIKVGNFINAVNSLQPFLITAIMTPKDFEKINSYQKSFNLSASGNMNNPDFTIQPNMQDYEFQLNLKNMNSLRDNTL